LVQLFHKADGRYNSGLFHFRTEKDQTDTPDSLTPNLVIDDKPLKDIKITETKLVSRKRNQDS
jgi:hypothetical protein